MWCTPTSGLLSAAASVLAALEPTPRHPVMPTPSVFSKEPSSNDRKRHTRTARKCNSIDVLSTYLRVLQRPLDGDRLCHSLATRTLQAGETRAHHVPLVGLHCHVGVNAAKVFMSVDVET